MISWLGNALAIINKLIPGRREKWLRRLGCLEVKLEKALVENNVLEIGRISKEIRKVRKLLERLG